MSAPIPITDAPRTVGPPETGVLGVGCGVVAVQAQVASAVQDSLRHAPSTQTRPLVQSVFTVQALLHATGDLGVGVAVGLT